MAIDFPSAPTTGDAYTYNGRSYRYNAQGAWERIGTAAIGDDTSPGVFESATQTEMEAASAVNVVVTPGRMQYHPGMAKAWIRFVGITTTAITVSHNVTSVTDNATGDTTINFTTAFSSGDYGMAFANQTNTGVAVYLLTRETSSATATTSCRVGSRNISGGALTDLAENYAVFFGDQ